MPHKHELKYQPISSSHRILYHTVYEVFVIMNPYGMVRDGSSCDGDGRAVMSVGVRIESNGNGVDVARVLRIWFI